MQWILLTIKNYKSYNWKTMRDKLHCKYPDFSKWWLSPQACFGMHVRWSIACTCSVSGTGKPGTNGLFVQVEAELNGSSWPLCDPGQGFRTRQLRTVVLLSSVSSPPKPFCRRKMFWPALITSGVMTECRDWRDEIDKFPPAATSYEDHVCGSDVTQYLGPRKFLQGNKNYQQVSCTVLDD